MKPQRMKKILIPMLPKKSNFNMNSLKEEYCFKFNTLLFLSKNRQILLIYFANPIKLCYDRTIGKNVRFSRFCSSDSLVLYQ